MFREEAVWVSKALQNVNVSVYPVVANIGSSVAHFRKVTQPHIHELIFSKLEAANFSILHIDAKQGDGVNITADVTDPDFGKKFHKRFNVVICTNLLEHVEDITSVANNLYACCASEAYLLITVPYKYKKHLDPIDNMFRPTPAEIAKLFDSSHVQVAQEKIITIHEKTYYTKKKSRFFLWSYREIIKYHIGLKHKVSGVLLKIDKR